MWLAEDFHRSEIYPIARSRRVVVAVPARDEAGNIAACLAALDAAAARTGSPVTIVVAANNCTDTTADTARRVDPSHSDIVVDEVTLPPARAHAGGARRYAMDRAAVIAGSDGVVMTTDADSRVDAGWIAANLGEIAAGVDAVAGMITFAPADRALLPELPARALEWRLSVLHARLEHLLDPRPHDPWPRHIWAWGASLAVTVAAYRAIGGVPLIPLAEDRALADAIERAGLRLRRSHAPLVYTSPRRHGRAPGGFADLLDSYATDPAALCDAALEPTAMLVRRLATRRRSRAALTDRFAAAWPAIDATIARRRIAPSDLGAEVARAERLIAALERRAARRAGSPPFALAA